MQVSAVVMCNGGDGRLSMHGRQQGGAGQGRPHLHAGLLAVELVDEPAEEDTGGASGDAGKGCAGEGQTFAACGVGCGTGHRVLRGSLVSGERAGR